ncbi:glutathione S-transferase family protein [Halomonas salipaludis]|uniref:Glutathione S-transferase n=1 Tax=Halomonas salipaludis TaxID=2032625 RepID=A0A2A2EUK1_9GAMM|nr:glutathione S-transferase family protein [Halomonas salipaludis]PAU76816.1 glutathione S-transferase [Halomonas salipaludis]
MQSAITFYTNPYSRGGIVHWMLEELGVPYRVEYLEYGTSMKAPDYLAINPMGKVPAIRHGDVVVTEAAAICAYLADAFPEAGLAPPPAERGDYYRWLFFASGPLEAAIGLKSCNLEMTSDQEMQLGCGRLETVVDVLADAVRGRRYIAADRFSAADVYVGSHIGWGMQFGTIDRRPEFEKYWQVLEQRPAHRNSMEQIEAAMAKYPLPDAGT